MANQLKMADVQAILLLKSRRWSNRRIALELGIDRETVGRYVRLAMETTAAPKPAKAPAGTETDEADEAACSAPLPESETSAAEANPAKAPAGKIAENEPTSGDAEGCGATVASELVEIAEEGSSAKPAKAPAGSEAIEFPADLVELARELQLRDGRGGNSKCAAYQPAIEAMLAQGLSCQRIYQDLRADGFGGSVYSVRRFVAQLLEKTPDPFRRMECGAGDEGLKGLGLATVTDAAVVQALQTLYPNGWKGIDQSEVLRNLFVHLMRRT